MSLNWPDENYAKLYTRDTPNWLMMPWQARALLPLMIRKADGAGFIDTGDRELAALSLVVQLPQDVVVVGLEALIDLGTVSRSAGGLELPNFVEAQEARKTEGQKKRDQRTKVRDLRRAEVRETVETPVPRVSPPSPQGVPLQLSSALPSSSSSSTPALPSSAQKAKRAPKAEQQPLIEAPPPAPRPPTRIGKLHEFFLEQRECRYVLPPPDGLEIANEVPPDEPADWGRSAAALAQWLKRWPDDPPEKQDQRVQAVILNWLEEPYWASPKADKLTGKVTPFPWGAFISGDQFAKACAKTFPEEAAA